MKKAALIATLAALVGCHAPLAPEEKGQSLEGIRLPLSADGRLVLQVHGAVGGTPAEVALELAEPLTLVTADCFPDGAPESERTVRVPKLEGGLEEHPEISLRGLRLGQVPLGPVQAGLLGGGKGCRVAVGSDVLAPYALAVDVGRRTVTFQKAGSAAQAPADPSRQVFRLPLSRDPQTDWPLLPVQLTQGRAALTGPFALTTNEAHTHLSGGAASQVGLRPASALIEALHLPAQIPLPPQLGGRILSADSVALTPSLSLAGLDLSLVPEWRRENPVGALGSDVWGRFDAVIDPAGHTLLLSRPRQEEVHNHIRCGAPGQSSEEACFQLESLPTPEGARAVVTVWRPMPKGGRIELEPLDQGGEPISASCRVGVTFSPQPAGASLAQRFPWASLEKGSPACARALSAARSFRFALWSEGPDRSCPGTCAFAEEPASGRTVCACEQGPEARFEAMRPMLDRLRELLKRVPVPEAPAEPEPDAR